MKSKNESHEPQSPNNLSAFIAVQTVLPASIQTDEQARIVLLCRFNKALDEFLRHYKPAAPEQM